MAGDWIKMRFDLHTHPKVVRIASALKADRLRVVGGLHAVWCVFDAHSEDGQLHGYTPEAMDDIIGWPGFTGAMIGVGWASVGGPEVLVVPRFDEHNGKSAKRRATDTVRKRDSRSADNNPISVQPLSAFNADGNVTREEKRREEESKEAGAGAPASPRGPEAQPSEKRKGSKITFATFMDRCKAANEPAIIAGDSVFTYARELNLPTEYLSLAWQEFKKRYTEDQKRKSYIDWRRVYRRAVEENWFKLWAPDEGSGWKLTAVGVQVQRAMKVRDQRPNSGAGQGDSAHA
jgi:hypothetical protein